MDTPAHTAFLHLLEGTYPRSDNHMGLHAWARLLRILRRVLELLPNGAYNTLWREIVSNRMQDTIIARVDPSAAGAMPGDAVRLSALRRYFGLSSAEPVFQPV